VICARRHTENPFYTVSQKTSNFVIVHIFAKY